MRTSILTLITASAAIVSSSAFAMHSHSLPERPNHNQMQYRAMDADANMPNGPQYRVMDADANMPNGPQYRVMDADGNMPNQPQYRAMDADANMANQSQIK